MRASEQFDSAGGPQPAGELSTRRAPLWNRHLARP